MASALITYYLGVSAVSILISYIYTHVVDLKVGARLSRWLGYGAGVYGVCIVWTAVVSYLNYSTYIDLSYYHSYMEQLSQWKVPLIWDIGIPVWSQHVTPFYFLFLPFYWFHVGQWFLVFIQAFLAVCAAFPLYAFTKKVTQSSRIGVCIVWSYLLFGGIQSSIYYGFHEVTFFPLLLFAVLWSWSIRRYWLFVLLSILMLSIKEEVAFLGICLGMVFLFFGSKKYAWTLIFLGIGWFLLSFRFIALFRPDGGYEYWGQFVGGSGGMWGVVRESLLHSMSLVQSIVFDDRKLSMLIESFGSFGFLPFLWIPNLIFLFPVLSMKLLSSNITMINSFHYSATYTGVLVGCVVFTLVKVIPKKYQVMAGIFVFLMACFGSRNYTSKFPLMTLNAIQAENFVVHDASRRRDYAISLLPHDASVNCQYQLCSHIDRPYGKLLPIPGPVFLDYMIIDRSLPIVLKTNDEIQAFFSSVGFGQYEVVYSNDPVWIFRKKLNTN